MQMVSEFLVQTARLAPDRVFLDDGARSLTYREVNAHAAQLANVLAEHGAGKDTPVGVYLPNSIELVLAYHACLKLGAIFVPITSMATTAEIRRVVDRTESPMLVTGVAGSGAASSVAAEVSSGVVLLAFGPPSDGCLPLDELVRAAPSERALEPCEPQDVAAVFFTSGTTGESKGAMQTHGAIYSTVRDMAVSNRFRFAGETLIGVLPMFNNFGATCMMLTATYMAGTLVVRERWDTEGVLADIGRHRATFFAGTPTMLVYLWKAYQLDVHDLSSLRLVITGGAPVPPEVIDAFETELGVPRVSQMYGATEVCGYITASPVVGVQKRGSAGPAFGSAEVTIVDDDGTVLPSGAVGEVLISGDTVGSGYWQDPETTAEAYTANGWRSGDLGYLDDDGYLFIVDRKKDLIISGGYNVYPLEIENVLYRHPAVEMCAVVGLPDAVKGEIPVLFLVPRHDGSEALADELIAYCRRELSAFKVPRRVEFLDSMPLGPTGKILKRELRRRGSGTTPIAGR